MDQRQYSRYTVECPATFTGDATGTGIVYNLGMGGCKVVSDLVVKTDAILSVRLRIPGSVPPISVFAVTVRWTMEQEFGAEFLGMHEKERGRLEQFLATLQQAVA